MSEFSTYTIRLITKDSYAQVRDGKVIDADYKFKAFICKPVEDLLEHCKNRNYKWVKHD